MLDKRKHLTPLEQVRAGAIRLDSAMSDLRDDLAGAPDDNARCRVLLGVDVPTLIQHNHGEFDVD